MNLLTILTYALVTALAVFLAMGMFELVRKNRQVLLISTLLISGMLATLLVICGLVIKWDQKLPELTVLVEGR